MIEKSGIMLVQNVKRFGYKSLLKMYIPCGRNLLRYLNTFLSTSAFERITYKPGKDYIDKNFRILNNLNEGFLFKHSRKNKGERFGLNVGVFVSRKKRHVYFASKFVISD